MHTAVVTGASGFVGRNLVKQLIKKNVKVYALVRNPDIDIFNGEENVHLVKYDLAEIEKIESILDGVSIDVFYHLAWQGAKGEGREDYVQQTQNAKYTCDAAITASRLDCKKFIAVGTITERLADEVLRQKSSSQNLIYGLTKSYTYKLLNVICAKQQMDFVWAELSNIYGGDDSSGNLISYTIDCFKKNVVPSFGPCLNPYDFIHIDDVSAALCKLGETKNTSGFYFIGRCENRTLKDYIEELGRIYGKEVNIGARQDDGLRYKKEWFDNTRLKEELNYKFKYNFTQGIMNDMTLED